MRRSILYEAKRGHGCASGGGTRLQKSAHSLTSDIVFSSRTHAHSAIRYAVNLHEHHGQSLNEAYASAVAQFRALRAEHDIASKIALREAEHNGIEFGPDEVERVWEMEEKHLDSWKRTAELSTATNVARKRWHAIVEETIPRTTKHWTRGAEYTRLWKEGVRPTYSPALANPSQAAHLELPGAE